MADKRGLEIVGVTFGLVTAIVIMVGGIIVTGHLNGQFTLDVSPGVDIGRPVASTLVGTILR
jgi:hypothetical protein